MEDAENTQEVIETPAAETQQAEPMIPKHRFDELAQRLRLQEEQNKYQQEALEMARSQFQRPQPQEDNSEFEALGIDQNTVRALGKIVEKKANEMSMPLRGAVGALGNKLEEAEFLLEYGNDKKKYLPDIRRMKQEYARKGMPLDTVLAFRMIRADEFEAKGATPKPEVKPEPKVQSAPPPAAKPAAKQSQSIEEMEAELEAGFQTHGSV